MEIENCPKCGRVFTKMSNALCDKCVKEDEDVFERIRDFLDEKPDSTLSDITEATGVTEKRVLKYIREGRLEATTNIGPIKCQKCGRPIKVGKYCDKCIIAINQDAKDLFAKKPVGARMHTAEDDKKKKG